MTVTNGITKNKVKTGCLFLLGSSVSTGAIVTEVQGNFLSKLGTLISQIPGPKMEAGDGGINSAINSVSDGLSQVPIGFQAIAEYTPKVIGGLGKFLGVQGGGITSLISNLSSGGQFNKLSGLLNGRENELWRDRSSKNT